jgi:cell division protein FtsN
VETARRRGLEPRLVRVPGSDLVRVRVGRFQDGGEAMDLRERLRGMGMEAIIVQDASREAPPR